MHNPHGWTPWPAPSPPSEPHHHLDLGTTLGRLLERSETTVAELGLIRRRLETGDKRMGAIETRLANVEKRPKVSALERRAKWLARYLLPFLALWATGTIEGAATLLRATH